MREIKFRAWDNNKKEMLYKAQLAGKVTFSGGMQMVGNNYSQIMQYTGLKDRHNKEIYEGDSILAEGILFEVYWDSKLAMFNLKKNDHITTAFLLSKTHLYEVIGNIYENPELLK